MATAPRRRPSSTARATDESRNGRGVTKITISAVEDETPVPQSPFAWLSPFHYGNRIPAIESFLKREEADVILVAGNVALVALEVIEWPVAVLTLVVHALARTRFKALESIAEVAEEVA